MAELEKRDEENHSLERKLREFEDRCKLLEQKHSSSSLSTNLIASNPKLPSKRLSRDFTVLQQYSTSEQQSRTKGRNSVNAIHRQPYSNKTSFDVYKNAFKFLCEKKPSEEHARYAGLFDVRYSVTTTVNTSYTGKRRNDSSSGVDYNSNSNRGAYKTNTQGFNVPFETKNLT